MHEEALTTELPRAAHADPTARITAVAGALLLARWPRRSRTPSVAVTLSLLGAGVVLALFVLVPRAAAAIRRHPVLLAGAFVAVIPVTFIFGVGYFGDGLYIYGLSDLLFDARAGRVDRARRARRPRPAGRRPAHRWPPRHAVAATDRRDRGADGRAVAGARRGSR